MKILVIGDVFGKPGRRAIGERLPRLIDEEDIEFVVANGENIAGGRGMTEETCEFLFANGVNVITSGNHARDKKEIDRMLVDDPRMLRPLNYPSSVPGKGQGFFETRSGRPIGVVNSMGKVHIAETESPFPSTRKAVEELRQRTNIVVVDFHAEATSEKRAMGWYLDGLATVVFGTHTHVQTADEEVLTKGTAYISDLGMTGPYDSVIGLRKDLAIERFLQEKRGKFDVGKQDIRLCGAIIEIDLNTGKAKSIRRVQDRIA